MMLIDGFFIVEYFLKFSKAVLVDENDPIFNSKLIAERVVRDLVLLENQIPFSVLQTLFDLSNNNKSGSLTLIHMALMSFIDLIPNEPSTRAVLSTAQESLPFVMELRRSGVKFKKGSISKTFESLIHISKASAGHRIGFDLKMNTLAFYHAVSMEFRLSSIFSSQVSVTIKDFFKYLRIGRREVFGFLKSLCQMSSTNGLGVVAFCLEVKDLHLSVFGASLVR
ncbi:hypothetical protein NE237_007910 [Protea cynaroides]|uniref:Uncharacterized protein n=1 Tax=Protea cynaroides TaxID=273540 RepID=A0A9Q0KR47_9MAGN|nr:hypothetical protein NE237_007910 [Protea cynaroides]